MHCHCFIINASHHFFIYQYKAWMKHKILCSIISVFLLGRNIEWQIWCNLKCQYLFLLTLLKLFISINLNHKYLKKILWLCKTMCIDWSRLCWQGFIVMNWIFSTETCNDSFYQSVVGWILWWDIKIEVYNGTFKDFKGIFRKILWFPSKMSFLRSVSQDWESYMVYCSHI